MKTLSSLALLGLVAVAAPASAAESYDSCTGFIDAVPATITTQGTWCLRKDLATAVTSGTAISIATNNVTIDCNGFKLGGLQAGPDTQAGAVFASNRLNLTVRNCAFRGFRYGVYLSGYATGGHLVEDNRMDQILGMAIFMHGDGNLIQRNRIFDTGEAAGDPIAIFASADIRDNVIDGMFGASAQAIAALGVGTEVAGNRIRNLVADGAGGINLSGEEQSAVGNRVMGHPGGAAQGNGIFASPASFCRDNVVTNFVEGIVQCEDNGGNVVH